MVFGWSLKLIGGGWGNSSWLDLCWILRPIALSCCVVSNAEHNYEAWSGEREAFSKGKTDSSLLLVTFVQFFFLLFGGVGVFWISRDFNGKRLHRVFSVTGKCSGLLDGWSPHPKKIRPAALVLFLLIRFQFSIWEYLPWQFSRSGINFCYNH